MKNINIINSQEKEKLFIEDLCEALRRMNNTVELPENFTEKVMQRL